MRAVRKISCGPTDQSGVLGSDIVALAEVRCEIVHFDGLTRIPAEALVISRAYGLGKPALVEFPVEVVVLFLFPGLAAGAGSMLRLSRWRGGLPARSAAVAMRSPNVTGLRGAGGDAAGPAGEAGDADAAVVEVAFDAAQGAAALEEVGVLAAFLGGGRCRW